MTQSAFSNIEKPADDLPLVAPLPADLSPVDVFCRLVHLPHTIFFDSAEQDSKQGRYSFVAADPFTWLTSSADESDPLEELRTAWRQYPSVARKDLPPFQGGAAGMFGYRLSHSWEKLPDAPIDDLPVPDLAVGLYDVVIAFDHVQGQAWILSQGFPETTPPARRERATSRLAEMQKLLRSPPAPAIEYTRNQLPSAELAPQFSVEVPSVTSNLSVKDYMAMVRRAIEYIHAGDVFQVNLSQRLLAPATTDAVDLYLRLREKNPAPYAGYLDLGPSQICSASPECFLTASDGQVETRPIKGTRGRSAMPEADLFAGDELQASKKDRAENVMIVDLLRNDLSRVCVPESIEVTQLCRLETYAFVQHLVSTVRGRLKPDADPFDLLRACFPGGSITGAPKIRAMEIIAELEPTARGAYCGSLAYIGFDGQMDSSILIRTITASKGWWQLPVGGGIVAQSNPEDEYRETWQKARGMLDALRE